MRLADAADVEGRRLRRPPMLPTWRGAVYGARRRCRRAGASFTAPADAADVQGRRLRRPLPNRQPRLLQGLVPIPGS
jgi:hypothetical protein